MPMMMVASSSNIQQEHPSVLTGSKTLPAQRRIFNILHLNFDTSTINNIMVNSYSAIEDRIDSAIYALQDGLYTNCQATAITSF